MRKLIVRIVVVLIGWFGCAQQSHAIGWDGNDFLIGGGPSFTTKIGVFDHDLTFKGLLDPTFITASGMDFDAQGRLVAVASGNVRSVRVYEPINGAIVGGFTRPDEALGTAADLKVAPDGSYIIATQNFGGGDGARQFAADGALIRQLGSGWIRGVAVIPGNRAWTAGVGSSGVNVFDLSTGNQTGTIAIAGPAGVNAMAYSASTQTVLIATIQSDAVFEVRLDGSLVQRYDSPINAQFNSVIRGPGGDVFATNSDTQSVFRWRSNGDFLGQTSTANSLGGVSAILWAGNVPEPGGSVGAMAAVALAAIRRRR